ncbi:MAG: Wzz/FepE/Etk N-terminal domain-containing protein [Polymorphobacter sp.]|uniref:Wzz/FepE/Etk N-terminal domain-containing protein n=1 Tax=Polymorphobacter sp. TaxID=1909290 RepID=UPI003A87931B
MSLIQFLNILLARRWIIVTSFVTTMVVAIAVGFSLPERYTASARVLMDIIRPDPVTGQMVGGRDPRMFIRTQIELIQDFRVAADVVDRLGWPSNPAVIAAWQEETGGVGDIRRWGAQRIIDDTSASLVAGSNILEISYDAPTPEAARTIASLLRTAYIEGSLRFTTDSAGRNAEWYRNQAERALSALKAAEAAKARFERENDLVMTADGEAESAKLAYLQSVLMEAQTQRSSQAFVAAQSVSTSPVVNQLKMQLTTLSDQMEQAESTLGTAHPQYKSMASRKVLLEEQLNREIAVARAAGAAQTGASRQSVAQIEAEYEAQKAKVQSMRGVLGELAQLDREVELRRNQYQGAAAREAELRLEANVSEGQLVVLGDAIGANTPSFPKWPQIIGLSAVFGLGLGLALALAVELLARRVRSPEDLRFVSGAPVLAVISDVKASPWRDRGRRWLAKRGLAMGNLRPAE